MIRLTRRRLAGAADVGEQVNTRDGGAEVIGLLSEGEEPALASPGEAHWAIGRRPAAVMAPFSLNSLRSSKPNIHRVAKWSLGRGTGDRRKGIGLRSSYRWPASSCQCCSRSARSWRWSSR